MDVNRGSSRVISPKSTADAAAQMANVFVGSAISYRTAQLHDRVATAAKGTEPALRVINEIGVETIHEHDLRLANRFREGLGQPPGDSAIVTSDVADAPEKLAKAGIMAAARAGRLRASFHVYNTEQDVDAALEALSP